MFVITNCIGDIVGRPQGYKKHATAQRVAERRGRIKTAIWGAYYAMPAPESGRKLVYSIRWAGPIDSKIIATETVINRFNGA